MTGPAEPAVDAFAESRERFETVRGWLEGREAGGLEHAELEVQLQVAGRELFRQLFQDHLDLRAAREQRIGVVLDADQVAHPSVEPGHTRGLATIHTRRMVPIPDPVRDTRTRAADATVTAAHTAMSAACCLDHNGPPAAGDAPAPTTRRVAAERQPPGVSVALGPGLPR